MAEALHFQIAGCRAMLATGCRAQVETSSLIVVGEQVLRALPVNCV